MPFVRTQCLVDDMQSSIQQSMLVVYIEGKKSFVFAIQFMQPRLLFFCHILDITSSTFDNLLSCDRSTSRLATASTGNRNHVFYRFCHKYWMLSQDIWQINIKKNKNADIQVSSMIITLSQLLCINCKLKINKPLQN